MFKDDVSGLPSFSDIFFMAGSIFDNSISVRQIGKQHNVEPVLKKSFRAF
jgi:hypothetical protein